MSDDGKSGGAAIWVAVIGALVTSGGYLFAYYKDLTIQEMSQKHDLVVELLTEDARESSRNLVWAHESGLILLSDETVSKLKEKPYEGPTRSDGAPGDELAFEDIVPSEDIIALVRGLDAGTKTIRSRALQSLLDATAYSTEKSNEAISAGIASLSGERLESLSANGRYNILYFLDRVDWSGTEARARKKMVGALNNILQRGEEGLSAVGPQTRALISSIMSKLS